jgi:hypothetical protein
MIVFCNAILNHYIETLHFVTMNVANQLPDDDPNGHIPPADDASAGTNSSIAEESQLSDSDLTMDDGSGSDPA